MRRILDVGQNILRRKAGHIRVACLTGIATSHLSSEVAGFLKDRSGVTMTIEPDRPGCILEWLIGEQYDFGITGGFNGRPAIESSNIEVRSVCVFPTGHELEKRLMHFVQMVLNFDKMSRQINHDLQDADGSEQNA